MNVVKSVAKHAKGASECVVVTEGLTVAGAAYGSAIGPEGTAAGAAAGALSGVTYCTLRTYQKEVEAR